MLAKALAASALALGVALAAPAAAAEQEDLPLSMSSLTGKPGDPANGRKLAAARKKGNCLACHVMPIPEEQFHGAIGPDLHGVGERLTEGEIRMRVVNPKTVNPDTIMPAFYRVDGLHRVKKEFVDKPILTAQEVEDLVAYLVTLKDIEQAERQ